MHHLPTCTVVMLVFYTVHQRVTQQQVGVCHVYFGAQGFFSVFVLAIAHFLGKAADSLQYCGSR
jgi:hypothetical protein